MTDDVDGWLRKQCLVMARMNHTPVPFWQSLPLRELLQWVRVNNRLTKQ